MDFLLILIGKLISLLSKAVGKGNGSTWPGHIALTFNPNFLEDITNESKTKIIVIAGTNGKTTTSRILTTLLRIEGNSVIQNTSGANLLNGIASALLLNTDVRGRLNADYAVFEVDENTLPLFLAHVTPNAVILLNLFRDQLDRYGELDSIAKKWKGALQTLSDKTTLILNADDPLVAYLAKNMSASIAYVGLSDNHKGQKSFEHAADSVYCPNCGSKLTYKKIFYSHLGIWKCPHCHIKRPKPTMSELTSPLPGTYNMYNTLAAVLTAKSLGISQQTIDSALPTVTPAFGRQEKLVYKGKQIQVFLSKNPISMNESLRAIADLGAKYVLFVLNDRIPDGRDVSWIWDIDVEQYCTVFDSIVVSGDRCYDMGLRIYYAQGGQSEKLKIIEDLKEAIDTSITSLKQGETLYVLPTYSAMLGVRKIVIGRGIL